MARQIQTHYFSVHPQQRAQIVVAFIENDYGKPVEVDFCDFASAGNSWTHGERYRVWLPEAYDNETK